MCPKSVSKSNLIKCFGPRLRLWACVYARAKPLNIFMPAGFRYGHFGPGGLRAPHMVAVASVAGHWVVPGS